MKHGFHNFLLEQIAFPLGDKLTGYQFCKELERQRAISALDAPALHVMQMEKLQVMLRFASEKSAWYAGLQVASISDPIAWLKRFPVLTKPVLRKSTDALLTKPKRNLISYPTSGSSGIQTEVFIDKTEESILRAVLINWWEWTGYFLGKPIAQTGITPNRGFLKTIKDFLTQTQYFQAFGLHETEILNGLRKIEGKMGYHLGGFASSLYVLAEVAKKHDIDIRFDAAISWGDKLFDHYKKSVEQTFQTKVFENYGLNEGFMVGMKKDLPHFYIYTPNVFFELLDENGEEVSDGEIGHVVLTKLDGFAMPLIRYHTGDLAVRLPKNRYPEYRELAFPLLERVVGRETDLVKTPEGGTLIVHTFTGIFEFFPEIRQFKVIQHERERIMVEYVASENFKPSVLPHIRREIQDKAKTSLDVDFRQVDFIPPSKSGKPQIIESTLAGNVFQS